MQVDQPSQLSSVLPQAEQGDCAVDLLLLNAAQLNGNALASSWAAAQQCVSQKHAHQLGLFDATLEQVEAVMEASGEAAKPVCNVVELHPLRSQRKLVGTCLRKVCSSVLTLRLSCLASFASCLFRRMSCDAHKGSCVHSGTLSSFLLNA